MRTMDEHNKYQFQLLLIGNKGVGKSCLISKFVKLNKAVDNNTKRTRLYEGSGNDDKDRQKQIKATAIDYTLLTVKEKDEIIKMNAYEPAFRSGPTEITTNYYTRTNGVIIVYDVTNIQSYEDAKKWLIEVKNKARSNPHILLVGNKSDMQQVVDSEIAEKYAETEEVGFLETSAETESNVKLLFETMAKEMKRRIDPVKVRSPTPTVKIEKVSSEARWRCCW